MRYLCLAVLFILSLNSYSQKIDREKLGYINYTQNPLSDVLLNMSYYELLFTTDDNDGYRRKVFEQNFDISPQFPVDGNQYGDFSIEVLEGTFTYSSPKISSYTDKQRRVHYYTSDMNYHYTIKVFLGQEEIFRDDHRGSVKVQGDRSESHILANEYHMERKIKVKQEIMPEIAQKMATLYLDQFGFITKTIFINAIRIKEKKFVYPKFNKGFEYIERVHAILKASDPTEESREKLGNAISIFESFVEDATPTEKKSKKNVDVTAAAYYNLGIAYFLDLNYSEASKAFKQAISYDEKVVYDVNYLAELCDELSQRVVFTGQ